MLSNCFANGVGVKKHSLVKAIYLLRQCLKNNENEEMYVCAKGSLESYLAFQSGVCSSCGHRETKFSLKCGRCFSAYYCNIDCQTNHWKNGHKEECKKP